MVVVQEDLDSRLFAERPGQGQGEFVLGTDDVNHRGEFIVGGGDREGEAVHGLRFLGGDDNERLLGLAGEVDVELAVLDSQSSQ